MRATLAAGEAPAVPAMPAAFEALFRKEYARVVAIAQRIVRDADEAEDVAQDVFVSFYRRHPGDAGYAPSFLSGQGSSLAVVGAYQLAAALAAVGGDHRVAFPAYERSMRHFVEQNQQLALKASGTLIPMAAGRKPWKRLMARNRPSCSADGLAWGK